MFTKVSDDTDRIDNLEDSDSDNGEFITIKVTNSDGKTEAEEVDHIKEHHKPRYDKNDNKHVKRIIMIEFIEQRGGKRARAVFDKSTARHPTKGGRSSRGARRSKESVP